MQSARLGHLLVLCIALLALCLIALDSAGKSHSAQRREALMRQPITPYLTVRDAAGAIAFYQKAFGATENMRMPAEDGKRLMHADLTINGGKIYLSDEFPEHDSVAAPAQGQRPPVAMALAFAQPAEVDAMFARATQAGAKAALPPGDMFWGERFAMLQDPYGHRWMLSAPLGK
jgi:PhnB protein